MRVPLVRFTIRWLMVVIAALACGLAFPPLLLLMLVVGAGVLTALLAVPVFLAISWMAGSGSPPDGDAGVWDRQLDS
jgi:hypothetical protein